jgi:arylsulfatase A
MKTGKRRQPPKKQEVTFEKVKGFHGDRPNIIIINCDDLGYGDLPPYGGTAIETPNIDKLAAGGVRFTSFYSCNALCSPSRFGLLTGRYPERAGLNWILLAKRVGSRTAQTAMSKSLDLYDRIGWRLYKLFSRFRFMDYAPEPTIRGLPEEELTIADALRSAGYRTGMVGKWHLGEFGIYPEFNPVRHGFDHFFGVPHSNDMKDFSLYRNEECLSRDFTEMDKLTALYTQEAMQFIRESEGKPFFLYFAHTYPHQPLYASEGFKGKSPGGRYGDTVEEIDWSVGELMKLLEERRQADNTLVVFTSDNGPWYNGSPGRLRGRKGQSYEGGFRIPMIAHWPARIGAGTVSTEPAMNIDWFPTCLSMAGLELPSDRIIDGENITGLITGVDDKSPHDCFYFYHNGVMEAIRMGKWKYIKDINTGVWPMPLDKYWKTSGSVQAPWLYNLETDEDESYNLRDDHQDVADRMDSIFKQWDKRMEENPGGWK